MAETKVNQQVNQQVIDAVTVTNLSVLGTCAEHSQAVIYEAMAHSLALILHNAGTAQQGAKQLSAASTAGTCSAILKAAG